MRARTVTLVLLPIVALLAIACGGTSDTPESTPSPTLVAATATPASTSTPLPTIDNDPYPAGSTGYAISWPQCGRPYPDEPFDFGIVGITNGQALTRNPCFADEYRWAQRGRYHPSIYMNINYLTSVDTADLRQCGEDASCRAYRYGSAAAREAYAYASSLDAVAPVWWLDVQIVSDWAFDDTQNAAAIRGAIEYLQAKGIRVGISSTAFQWANVAGDAQYGLPIWDASATDADVASIFCSQGKDFGGGHTEQIAYVADGFETVLACGGPGGALRSGPTG